MKYLKDNNQHIKKNYIAGATVPAGYSVVDFVITGEPFTDAQLYTNGLAKWQDNSGTAETAVHNNYTAYGQTDTEKWVDIRADRNNRLAACDWTQSADTSLIAAKVTEWVTYRTALKDVPQDNADVDNISWPTKPT